MKIIMNVPSCRSNMVDEMLSSAIQNLPMCFYWNVGTNGPEYDSPKFKWDNNLYHIRKELIDPTSDYTMLIDDDAIFEAGSLEYFNMIVGLLENEQPSVLSVFKNRYSNAVVRNPKNCIMTTNRGLFIKTELLLDLPDMEMHGACEDAIFAYHALNKEYKHIRIGGAPVTNRGVHHLELNSESAVHDLEIYQNNARKYIRETYNDPEWDVLTGETPKGIKR